MEKSVTPGGTLNCGRRVRLGGADPLCDARHDIHESFKFDINSACLPIKHLSTRRYLQC